MPIVHKIIAIKRSIPFQYVMVNFLPAFMLIKAIELYVVMIASFSRLSLKQGLTHLGFGQKKPILHRMMKIQAKVWSTKSCGRI